MDLNTVQEDHLDVKNILTKCYETNNGIITEAYIDESKISFINIGERIILDKTQMCIRDRVNTMKQWHVKIKIFVRQLT